MLDRPVACDFIGVVEDYDHDFGPLFKFNAAVKVCLNKTMIK